MPLINGKSSVSDKFNALWFWKIDELTDAGIPESIQAYYPDKTEDFKNIKRKLQWSVSRKIVLDNFPDKTVFQHSNGYPEIKDIESFISITHCGDYLIVRTSQSPVGIDLERISERILKIRSRFLNEREMMVVDPDNLEHLTIAWTVKEAIYKMMNRPGLEFKTQIIIEDINFMQQRIKVSLKNGDEIKSIRLSYEKFENYIFTQTI